MHIIHRNAVNRERRILKLVGRLDHFLPILLGCIDGSQLEVPIMRLLA